MSGKPPQWYTVQTNNKKHRILSDDIQKVNGQIVFFLLDRVVGKFSSESTTHKKQL